MPDITLLSQRIVRAKKALLEKTFSVAGPDGTSEATPMYQFEPGKSHEDIHDAATRLLSDVWHLRDYIKTWCDQNGKPVADITATVKGSKWIAICADLTNEDKHCVRTKSDYTKKNPRFGQSFASFTTIGKLELARGRPMRVSNPVPVWQDIEILDQNGNRLGSAREVAENALADWEALMGRLGVRI